jgi:hypothetical protein
MEKRVRDKRTAIMEAALKLFTERGFHGIYITDLESCKCSRRHPLQLLSYKRRPHKQPVFRGKKAVKQEYGEKIEFESTFKDKMRRLWSNMIK